MYAKYLRERTEDLIMECDFGFATYRYLNDRKTVYIMDIFVDREARQRGLASDMANEISREAKELGCVEMLGTIKPSAKGSTTGLKVLLAYGMTLHSASDVVLICRKDL